MSVKLLLLKSGEEVITEVKIPLNHNMVVTILEPMPSLRDTYITNVQKMGGNVE